MDKNTVIGFVLIAAVLFGFSWYSSSSSDEQQPKAKTEQVKASTDTKKQDNKATEEVKEDPNALFASAKKGVEEKVVLKNDKVVLTFSTKGATVEKAEINEKDYRDRSGKGNVVLFDEKDQKLNFSFYPKTNNFSTQDLYFTAEKKSDKEVVFTAEAAPGKSISISYVLGDSYMLHMKMGLNGMQDDFNGRDTSMDILWTDNCRQQEKGHSFENRYASVTYHTTEGDTDHLSESSKDDEKVEDALDWVAFKSQFFSAIMISKNDFEKNADLKSSPCDKQSGYLKNYSAKMRSKIDVTGKETADFDFYFGPNDFRGLQAIEEECNFGKDLELERLVYLGWPLFRIINRWFTLYVFDWLTGWGIPMGIVLILLTLLLKFITYPMVRKSFISSAKMRVLKPKLEEATKQYNGPDQQMQKQQAMMQEYSKYGVSPMAGCLPMLIQMPIWIAMFNFVPNAIQLRDESFLWIKDLSSYDPIIEWNSSLWLIGDHLSLTCILFCVGNLLYTWMTMRQQRDQMIGQQAQQMKMMQWMMFLMPLMFFFMFNDYSAGLNFYYFVSLFFSAAIMWALRRFTDDKKLLAKLEARYEENKNKPQKLTGLAARLQAMQEEQARLQKQREELARKRRDLNNRN